MDNDWTLAKEDARPEGCTAVGAGGCEEDDDSAIGLGGAADADVDASLLL